MTSILDIVIKEIDKGLKYSTQNFQKTKRDYPADNLKDTELSELEKYHSAGLMRVNHSGEVCAQALYRGQASTAELKDIKASMEKAAQEELDHLAWCNKRLMELGSNPSILDPLWYGTSFSLGAIAGIIGDKWSLGFVEETEKQVVEHLDKHIKQLSHKDTRSMAIIKKMREEEEEHAKEAKAAGAVKLPKLAKKGMSLISRIMTSTSYHI